MLNGKTIKIILIVELIKKTVSVSEYFPRTKPLGVMWKLS